MMSKNEKVLKPLHPTMSAKDINAETNALRVSVLDKKLEEIQANPFHGMGHSFGGGSNGAVILSHR